MTRLPDEQVAAMRDAAEAQLSLLYEIAKLRRDNDRLRALLRELMDVDKEPTHPSDEPFLRDSAERVLQRDDA